MWFAVLPAQNKFIYSESKGELIGLANNLWYNEQYMIISEQGFNEIYVDQCKQGHKMTQVVIRTERQPRRTLPRLPTQPTIEYDIPEPEPEPKEDISERFMRRLGSPKMMEHITKSHPYSKHNYSKQTYRR